jgi:deazaflavin-dependent oxidoreductase (nitroreductase family)
MANIGTLSLMALPQLKRALEEVEITVTGRRSGRDRSLLVWFVQEDDKLYLLPLKGTDTEWYRNVLKTPTMRLASGGAEATATATPTTDPAKVSDVVEKFRAKHGDDVARYYEKFDAAVEVPLA